MKPSPHVGSKRHFLVVVLVSAMALLAGSVLPFICYKPAPTQLHLVGTSAEIGTAYGRALAFRMKLVTRIYLDRIVCGGDKALIQSRQAKAMASMTNWPPVLQRN